MDLVSELARGFEDKRVNHIEIIDTHVHDPALLENAVYYGPFMVVEGVLGIPKKHLNKAFITLRKEYSDKIKRFKETDCRDTSNCHFRLFDLTLVVLIVTTENLQAINCRKRLILQDLKLKDDMTRLKAELRVLDILFNSDLVKHTKSPMLWQHRKWIKQHFSDLTGPLPTNSNPDNELDVIFSAGQLHPKNYYAWSYLRWYLSNDISGKNLDLRSTAEKIYSFCISHVSDISSWTSLFYVLKLLADLPLTVKYIRSSLDYSVIVPGHESLWFFAKTSISYLISLEPSYADILISDVEPSRFQREDQHLLQHSMKGVFETHERMKSKINSKTIP